MRVWGWGLRVEGAPVHALPSAPVCPARHVQLDKTVLPASEVEKAGHAPHSDANPLWDEYVPAVQGLHAPAPPSSWYV